MTLTLMEWFERLIDADRAHAEVELNTLERTDPELSAQLRRLLNADRDQTFWKDKSVSGEALDAALRPNMIGPFRVIKELGRGGMGVVYLAERDDEIAKHRVAIKLSDAVHATANRIRFAEERRILAQLMHPQIAGFIDGGDLPDGRAYLVMEFIDGEPINVYAQRHALTFAQRIELFIKVLAPIAHAHAQLFVHRDLKPSNILVDRAGIPILIDFGISKQLDSDRSAQTQTGNRMYTLNYCAPEQVFGPIAGIAADVYSLGVVLYELLAGTRPYALEALSWREAEQQLRSLPVAAPSSVLAPQTSKQAASFGFVSVAAWQRALRGDLDAIICKALEKNAEQRYRTIDQFLNELENFQHRRPVQARRPYWGYRAGKFLSRHRFGVIAAGLVLMLASGALMAYLQKQFEATRASERSAAIAQFLVESFRAADPNAGGTAALKASDLIDQAAQRASIELHDQPKLQTELYLQLAKTAISLESIASSDRLLAELAQTQLSPEQASELEVLRIERLAFARAYREIIDAGKELIDKSSLSAEKQARVLRHWANSGCGIEDPAPFLTKLEMHLQNSDWLSQLDVTTRTRLLSVKGYCLVRAGQLDSARETYQTAQAVISERYPKGHPESLGLLFSLASVEARRKAFPEQLVHAKQALTLATHIFGAQHPRVGRAHDVLAQAFKNTKQFQLAIEHYQQSLAIQAQTRPANDQSLLGTHFNLGIHCLNDVQDAACAKKHFAYIMEQTQQSMGNNTLLRCHLFHAWALIDLRELERATSSLALIEKAAKRQSDEFALRTLALIKASALHTQNLPVRARAVLEPELSKLLRDYPVGTGTGTRLRTLAHALALGEL